MLKTVLRLPGENNSNYSYRAIKEGILSLELHPGELLRVGELSETLKVSSTPIKNALWKLQQEHLIELIPQVGTYVTKINLELAEEAASMWFDLEKKFLEMACSHFPADYLQQLKTNVHLQNILVNQKSGLRNEKELANRFFELDDQFHMIIFCSHERKNTWKAISQMASNYHRIITLNQSEDYVKRMVAEHNDILSILENKEVERVEPVLRNHIFKPIENWRKLQG